MRSPGWRVVLWIVMLLVGAFYGAAGSFAHAMMVADDTFPLGIIIALIGAAGLLVAVRLLSEDRWATLAVGIGMAGATWVFTLPAPGGSVIFTAVHPVLANVWMIAVPILTLVVAFFPPITKRRAQDSDSEPESDSAI